MCDKLVSDNPLCIKYSNYTKYTTISTLYMLCLKMPYIDCLFRMVSDKYLLGCIV